MKKDYTCITAASPGPIGHPRTVGGVVTDGKAEVLGEMPIATLGTAPETKLLKTRLVFSCKNKNN